MQPQRRRRRRSESALFFLLLRLFHYSLAKGWESTLSLYTSECEAPPPPPPIICNGQLGHDRCSSGRSLASETGMEKRWKMSLFISPCSLQEIFQWRFALVCFAAAFSGSSFLHPSPLFPREEHEIPSLSLLLPFSPLSGKSTLVVVTHCFFRPQTNGGKAGSKRSRRPSGRNRQFFRQINCSKNAIMCPRCKTTKSMQFVDFHAGRCGQKTSTSSSLGIWGWKGKGWKEKKMPTAPPPPVEEDK